MHPVLGIVYLLMTVINEIFSVPVYLVTLITLGAWWYMYIPWPNYPNYIFTTIGTSGKLINHCTCTVCLLFNKMEATDGIITYVSPLRLSSTPELRCNI